MLSETEKVKHLLNRAAYGYTPEWWDKDISSKTVLQYLFDSAQNYNTLRVVDQADLNAWLNQKKNDPQGFVKTVSSAFKDLHKELNDLWLKEQLQTPGVLREKLAVFWHSNLAARETNPYFCQQYLDVIRKHALGNFGTMLREVSKTPAMLKFLNNQQNKKDHPNENFAREVMELFTLGRGQYSEQDVKEAARAFTGWGYSLEGEFKFRVQQHDFGQKTIFGKKGNFSGDDVLDMLLEKKACAYHITKKIYAYFVNEDIDEQVVTQLAEQFYQGNYEIAPLLRSIFSSDWFYADQHIGAKIKSPNDLLIGMFRTVPVSFSNELALPFLQKMLDQVLLFPPNVAGWPGGKAWIDSSSLMTRLQLPGIIYYDQELKRQPKAEFSEMGEGKGQAMMEQVLKKLAVQKLGANADWQPLLKAFRNTNITETEIWMKMIVKSIVPDNLGLLKKYADESSPEARIKSLVVRTMSLPEYQLC